MDKQNVTLKTHELEVIGQGGMIEKSCQMGAWQAWLPEEFPGKIPTEVQIAWDNFKTNHPEALGYFIAEDMREVDLREKKKAKEKQERVDREVLERRLEAMELRAIEAERRMKEAEERLREPKQQRQAAVSQQHKAAAEKFAKNAVTAGGTALVVIGKVLGVVAVGTIMVVTNIFMAVLSFDPILVAVLPPDSDYPGGRFVEVASWWD
jgi:hypothetical protein